MLGGPPPPGTVLGTPDDTVRLVLTGTDAAGGLVLGTIAPGSRLQVGCGGSSLVRELTSVSAVTSIAHLDPLTLVHPGQHVVRIVAG